MNLLSHFCRGGLPCLRAGSGVAGFSDGAVCGLCLPLSPPSFGTIWTTQCSFLTSDPFWVAAHWIKTAGTTRGATKPTPTSGDQADPHDCPWRGGTDPGAAPAPTGLPLSKGKCLNYPLQVSPCPSRGQKVGFWGETWWNGILALTVGDPWTQKTWGFASDALPFVPPGPKWSRVVGKVGFACNGASPRHREASQRLGNSLASSPSPPTLWRAGSPRSSCCASVSGLALPRRDAPRPQPGSGVAAIDPSSVSRFAARSCWAVAAAVFAQLVICFFFLSLSIPPSLE